MPIDIPYPNERSEFEIQAWLFAKLRQAGFDVRGEVRTSRKFSKRVQALRFDLVFFEAEKPFRIVEVKGGRTDTNVVRKYLATGVPVDLVWNGVHQEYLEWILPRAKSKEVFGHSETLNGTSGHFGKGALCNCGRVRRSVYWNCTSCRRRLARGLLVKCSHCARAIKPGGKCQCETGVTPWSERKAILARRRNRRKRKG